jgi:hypothetical protein
MNLPIESNCEDSKLFGRSRREKPFLQMVATAAQARPGKYPHCGLFNGLKPFPGELPWR